MSWEWPAEMVMEFAALWEASSCQLTLTGSYIKDREEYPGFYRCVLEYLSLKHHAQDIVKNTVDAIQNG